MPTVRKHERRRILSDHRQAYADELIDDEELAKLRKALCSPPRRFPSNSEERMRALLAVSNTEIKSILTMLLSQTPTSMGDLKQNFEYVTEGLWVTRAFTGHVEGALSDSFYPYGLVSFNPVDNGEENIRIEARLTNAGLMYAKPFAAFCLDIANRFDTSMYQIFGQSRATYENTSPMIALSILEFLLDHKNARVTDIKQALGFASDSITWHLENLNNTGLVDYEHAGKQNRWAVYKWKQGKPKDVKTIHRQRKITDIVANYLYQLKEADRHTIAECMKATGEFDNYQDPTILHWASNILSGLRSQGFASAKFTQGVRSRASLTSTGTEFTTEFSRKLRNMVENGPELEEMQKLVDRYSTDGQLFRMHATGGLAFYLAVRPSQKSKTAEEWNSEILHYLEVNGRTEASIISDAFEGRIAHQLRRMASEGLIDQEHNRGKTYYSLKTFSNGDIVRDTTLDTRAMVVETTEEYVMVAYEGGAIRAKYPIQSAREKLRPLD